jgi:hypothetical protein
MVQQRRALERFFAVEAAETLAGEAATKTTDTVEAATETTETVEAAAEAIEATTKTTEAAAEAIEATTETAEAAAKAAKAATETAEAATAETTLDAATEAAQAHPIKAADAAGLQHLLCLLDRWLHQAIGLTQ